MHPTDQIVPRPSALAEGPEGAPPRAPVEVEVEACRRLAGVLLARPIPMDEEDSSLEGFSRVQVGNFYLLLVAICHQTSPRGKPALEGTVGGVHRRGWDYLSAKLEAATRSDLTLLQPGRWAEIRVGEFTGIFRDKLLGERMSDPDRRTALVQDLGRVMIQSGWGWIEEAYRLCEGRVASGEPNLFGLLTRFAAYRDPVRKKSSFFLALMRNTGLWSYVDDAELGPPVDYHEVRGHLRVGTIVVSDPILRRKLLRQEPVTEEEDVAIRRAVYDAIMLLSELTGLRNPSQLHYLFWNVFRTHCRRDAPLCFAEAPTLAARYQHLAEFGDEIRCPFSGVCASAARRNATSSTCSRRITIRGLIGRKPGVRRRGVPLSAAQPGLGDVSTSSTVQDQASLAPASVTPQSGTDAGFPRERRFIFVQLLFSLTAAEIARAAAELTLHDGEWASLLPAYGHLVLATTVVATSWVGWSVSEASLRLKVGSVFSWPFVVLLTDVALVIFYFILVRGAEIPRANADVQPSARNECDILALDLRRLLRLGRSDQGGHPGRKVECTRGACPALLRADHVGQGLDLIRRHGPGAGLLGLAPVRERTSSRASRGQLSPVPRAVLSGVERKALACGSGIRGSG